MFLVTFALFLVHQPIFYAELLVIYEGLKLANELGYYVLEVGPNLATVDS